MKKQLLRVMMSSFTDWLRIQMDPRSKTVLHDFDGITKAIIDSVPDEDVPEMTVLDAKTLESGVEWVLNSMRSAYPEAWPALACEVLRLLIKRNSETIAALAQPLPSSGSTAISPNPMSPHP
jgi:hypothetical protein